MNDQLNDRARRDAALVRDALELHSPPHQDGPTAGVVVALSGPPGVGKSYFAGRLAEKLPCVVLESDRIRKLLVASPRYTGREHARVFAVCHLLVEECLTRGHRVLFDATNLSEGVRRPLRRICRRLSVPLMWVRVTASQDVVKERLDLRDGGTQDGFSDAGWAVYCRMAPGEEPIKGPHVTVDSSSEIANVVEQIARLAAASGEPVAG